MKVMLGKKAQKFFKNKLENGLKNIKEKKKKIQQEEEKKIIQQKNLFHLKNIKKKLLI